MAGAQAQSVSAQDIARCATIAPDVDRLACYDRLARDHSTGGRVTPSSPSQPSPPAPTSEAPGQSFGMAKPPKPKTPEPARLEAKVLDITTDSHGLAVVQLDNDQTWRLDEGTVMLRAGDAIVIKPAALGSYLMTTPTSRVYRVRRIR